MNWQANILTKSAEIRHLLTATRTIAVLGIKTEAQPGQPAFYVPSYLQSAGFEIIPVPVYFPKGVALHKKSLIELLLCVLCVALWLSFLSIY